MHTLLRLPTGIFYAQGVKANVLFFDRKPASEKPWTEKLWIYDFRTNMHITLKTNPLKSEDLQDFVACYKPDDRHNRKESERFRALSYDELVKRDKLSLDIFWLKDDSLEDSDNLPDPDTIALEIVENLEAALEQFSGIYETLKVEYHCRASPKGPTRRGKPARILLHCLNDPKNVRCLAAFLALSPLYRHSHKLFRTCPICSDTPQCYTSGISLWI